MSSGKSGPHSHNDKVYEYDSILKSVWKQQ